jgi:hypothetical protein
LAYYYKHKYCDACSPEEENVYDKCASVLSLISFDLERNCPFSVFKHIHEFLMLVSDEVYGKVVINNGDE